MQTVEIIIDNKDDYPKVRRSGILKILNEIGVSSGLSIFSNPDELRKHYEKTLANNTKVFICVASTFTTLPEAIATAINNQRPILGVALSSGTSEFDYQFAISSLICLPTNVLASFCGSDTQGLVNAALLACQMLALSDKGIATKLEAWQKENIKTA